MLNDMSVNQWVLEAMKLGREIRVLIGRGTMTPACVFDREKMLHCNCSTAGVQKAFPLQKGLPRSLYCGGFFSKG